MNERIKELFKRAGGKTSIHNLMSNPMQQREYSELWDDNITKFAELIVLDCIEVCKSRVGNSDYNTGRLHCVSDIRERFGLNGMSTEDKKTLIKELLGVKE
jgi:hypothetical protein